MLRIFFTDFKHESEIVSITIFGKHFCIQTPLQVILPLHHINKGIELHFDHGTKSNFKSLFIRIQFASMAGKDTPKKLYIKSYLDRQLFRAADFAVLLRIQITAEICFETRITTQR